MSLALFQIEQLRPDLWHAEVEIGGLIARREMLQAPSYAEIMVLVHQAYRRMVPEAPTVAMNVPVTRLRNYWADSEPTVGGAAVGAKPEADGALPPPAVEPAAVLFTDIVRALGTMADQAVEPEPDPQLVARMTALGAADRMAQEAAAVPADERKPEAAPEVAESEIGDQAAPASPLGVDPATTAPPRRKPGRPRKK